MRLNAKESKILSCIELKGNACLKELRKETGYRDHTIRYCLKGLQNRGLIVLRPLVNLSVFGLHEYTIYLSTELKRSLDSYPVTSDACFPLSVRRFSGRYDFSISVWLGGPNEVNELILSLIKDAGVRLREKRIASVTYRCLMGRGYICPKKDSSSLTYFDTGDRESLDEIDRSIISKLLLSSTLSHRAIARKLGVPASTIDFRIKRLEDRGVVVGWVYDLNTERVNAFRYRALLEIKNDHKRVLKYISTLCHKSPNAISIKKCVSSWDVEIDIEAFSTANAMCVIESIQKNVGSCISNIELLTELGCRKVGVPDTGEEAFEFKKAS